MVDESTFSVEAMIRGYHIYKDVWTAIMDEELCCRREPFNTADPFAVAVVREDTVVGHVPRKMSVIVQKGGYNPMQGYRK
jgi:hypothetical protein